MSENKLNRGEKIFFVLCAVAVIAGLVAGIVLFSSNQPVLDLKATGHGAVAEQSQDLNGKWSTANNGTILEATVQDQTIKIVLKNTDITMTYWAGTFPSSATVGSTIASVRDQSEISMVMDSVQTKNFEIGNNTLTFDMSALGMTKTVHLSHV